MNRLTVLVRAGLIVCLCSASSPAAAQEAPPATPAPGGLEEQVAQLNHSLDRIASMLEQVLDVQQADLLMKRLQLLQARLAPGERDLTRAVEDYSDREEESVALRDRWKAMEAQIREEEKAGDPDAARDLEMIRLDFEAQTASVQRRLDAAYLRVQELENGLAASREDIAILEELLDERLGLR